MRSPERLLWGTRKAMTSSFGGSQFRITQPRQTCQYEARISCANEYFILFKGLSHIFLHLPFLNLPAGRFVHHFTDPESDTRKIQMSWPRPTNASRAQEIQWQTQLPGSQAVLSLLLYCRKGGEGKPGPSMYQKKQLQT